MPASDNFKGRDVKFNVKLPQDLLGEGHASPAVHKAHPHRRRKRTHRHRRHRKASAKPTALYQEDEQDDLSDYSDDLYDSENDYDSEQDGVDWEYEQFAQNSKFWNQKPYQIANGEEPSPASFAMNLNYRPHA